MSTTQTERIEKLATEHYDADAGALANDETLETDEPVAWMTGVEEAPEDDDVRDAIIERYQEIRDEHGGRPREDVR